MIVLLKDKSILTLRKDAILLYMDKGCIHLGPNTNNRNKNCVYVMQEHVLAIFADDEDYVQSIGAELVRDMK